jgi:UDP:flavonoid glycosyltransferase YjiC (YdhE family)
MAQFLFIPVGSSGDTYPSIGIGRELRARAHRVTVFANGYFKGAVERAGLEFVEAGSAEEYLRLIDNPDLWNPKKGLKAVVGSPGMQDAIRAQYRLIEARLRDDPNLIVVGGSLALGARIAEEKLGVKLAALHLQPVMFVSGTNPPVPPTGRVPGWIPPVGVRFLYWFADKFLFGPAIGQVVEPFRRELGLPKATNYICEWMHAKGLPIGLFPKWFGYAPDWPPALRLTGFPLYDDRADQALPGGVARFIDAGPAPVVRTFGSGMKLGAPLFAAAAEACALLGRRGILLTPFREQLPARLPDNVVHFPYVPLTTLLPRAAALVHHGGIGTTSQALRAGVPQVITPLAHDQPDNADRVAKLGVGCEVASKKITGAKLAAGLRAVLDNPRVANACKDVARRFERADAIGETCALLEGFARRSTPFKR